MNLKCGKLTRLIYTTANSAQLPFQSPLRSKGVRGDILALIASMVLLLRSPHHWPGPNLRLFGHGAPSGNFDDRLIAERFPC
jgi:hypothetical protein